MLRFCFGSRRVHGRLCLGLARRLNASFLCALLLSSCHSEPSDDPDRGDASLAPHDAGSPERDAGATHAAQADGGIARTCGPVEGARALFNNELACNGWDDDCDGRIDEGGDVDGDGRSICKGADGLVLDCDDSEPSAWTGRAELCDGLDNDCDGAWDEGLAGPCPAARCTAKLACPMGLVCIERGAACVARAECPAVTMSREVCDPPSEQWRRAPCDPSSCRRWQQGTCWGTCECADDGVYRWRPDCTE